MQIKRFLLLIISIFTFAISISAQKLTVESLVQTNDVIARSRNVIGTDGNVCAAVVVRIPSASATFDGGFIIGKSAYKNGEYIIDMQTGAAQMRVSVPGYNTIDVKFRDYLGSTLQSKTTYLLTINMPQLGADVQKKQTLNIKVTPSDAVVLIDNEMVEERIIELPLGSHSYNVVANGYLTQSGNVNLTGSAPGKLIIELDKKQTTTQSNSQASDVVTQSVQEVTPPVSQGNVAEDLYKKATEYSEKKDYTQAVYWLRQAAEQGNALSQCDLGTSYLVGLGVKRDLSQAAYWIRKSAEQGNTSAQSMLASMYRSGLCVKRDYTQAVFWYRKAAEQGDALAQYDLAQMYYYGRGVSKDKNEARLWYEKAAEQGHKEAKEKLKKM